MGPFAPGVRLLLPDRKEMAAIYVGAGRRGDSGAVAAGRAPSATGDAIGERISALVGRQLPHRRKLNLFVAAVVVGQMLSVLPVGLQLISVGEMLAQARRDETHHEVRHRPKATRTKKKVERSFPVDFPQNDRGLYKLEFVHIPKTGGTSIEIAAARSGIAWGICKFRKFLELERNRENQSARCRALLPFRDRIKLQNSTDWDCRTHGPPWHCPPRKYKHGNKYEGVDTFTVVRNPYDRMISEYYYRWARGINRKDNFFDQNEDLFTRNETKFHYNDYDINDSEFMNRWVSDAVRDSKSKGHCYKGHCVPYYKFVYAKNGTRIVNHILKMENLTEEFQALMDLYQLPLKLGQHNAREKKSTLGVEDLSAETIAKINERFRLDFEIFGYEMLDPK